MLILALTAAIAILVRYACSYFFLLDDFMVAHEASRTVADLASSPVYNFYRPAGYLWGKALFEIFGWDHPAGHSALTMVVHAACAFLVMALARRSGVRGQAAWLAGALFLLSPWGTEAFLYLSGGFDLVATAGLLVCVVAGLSIVPKSVNRDVPADKSPLRRTTAIAAAGVTGAVIALFAKETGVVAAAMVAFAVVCLDEPRALLSTRAVVYVVLLW